MVAPRLRLLSAALAALGLAAPAARAADHAVSFPSGPLAGAYAPQATEALPGDTVTFSGAFASHPLVWSDGDFPTTSSGTTQQLTFARPGLYRFHCQIHASMTGSVHVAGNQFATPDFTAAPSAPETGQAVTFTATAFSDPDGTIVAYEWDLDGDGSFETTTAAGTVTRSYAAAGTVHVALRYLDDGHETSPATAHDLVVAAAAGAAGTQPPAASDGGTAGAGQDGAAAPALSPAAPGAALAPARVRLRTRALAFRGGTAALALSAGVEGPVRVTLRAGRVVLARGRGTVRGGAATVRLRLTPEGASRLRRGRVRAAVSVVLADGTAVRAAISAGPSAARRRGGSSRR